MIHILANVIKRPLAIPRAALFFLLLAFLTQCQDDELVGLEVQPESDQLGLFTSDTFVLDVRTVTADSVRTDETSTNLAGSMVDPEFGKTTAGMYVQFRLERENLDLGDLSDFTFDSCIVSFRYLGFWGDSASPQTFRLYEILDPFEIDSTYYSNKQFTIGTEVLGELVDHEPRFADSIQIGDDEEPAQLRFRMSDAFGQRLLDGAADDGSGQNYTDSESFIEAFQGMYVVAENPNQMAGEGGLFSFNMLSSFSRMVLYFTQNSTGDALTFTYPINSLCARATTFSHEYTGFPIEPFLSDSTSGSEKLYLQSAAGTKVSMRIPGLFTHPDFQGPVVINKAELIVPVEEGDFGIYDPPSDLNVVGVNSSGNEVFVVDQFVSENHIGGSYNSNDNEYTFRVTRQIQRMLDDYREFGEATEELRVIASGSAVNANRVILNGTGVDSRNFRLILSYTPIN